MKTLADIGPAKLHEGEQQLVRDTADELFFSEAPAGEALQSADELIARLVESGRLLDETAYGLLKDLEDCGPPAAIASR